MMIYPINRRTYFYVLFFFNFYFLFIYLFFGGGCLTLGGENKVYLYISDRYNDIYSPVLLLPILLFVLSKSYHMWKIKNLNFMKDRYFVYRKSYILNLLFDGLNYQIIQYISILM